MPYGALTDSEIQPGEPISQSLMQKIKDNFDDHEARIAGGGGGASAGAVGEILNGSLEADGDGDGIPDNFLVNYYPGGTGGYDTTDYVHGTKSWRFDLHGGANTGGGYLETDYIFANRLFFKPIWLAYKTSATSGTPRVQVIARCFNKTKAYLGEVVLWNTVTHLPDWSLVVIHHINSTYNDTEYVKLRLVGGAVDPAGVVGSVWFDAIGVEGYGGRATVPEAIVQPRVSIYLWWGWTNAGSVFNISIPAGKYQWLLVPVTVAGASGWGGEYQESYPADVRCYIGSAYSSVVTSPNATAVTGNCVLNIGGMSGAKQLRFQAKGNGGGWFESPASLRKFYATNFRDVDHGAGTEADTYVKPSV